jgi:hypothetical protein
MKKPAQAGFFWPKIPVAPFVGLLLGRILWQVIAE